MASFTKHDGIYVRDGTSDAEARPIDANNNFNPDLFDTLSRAQTGHFWYDARHQLVATCVDKFFPDATTFHEAGCGTGGMLIHLSEKTSRLQLSGSDPFLVGLREARERGLDNSVDLYHSDVASLPSESKFDIVGAFDVIEHLDDDRDFLSGLSTVLCPGGGLMLTAPQHQFMWSTWDEANHHKRRYERGGLARLVEESGFNVMFSSSFVTFLLPVAFIRRLASKNNGSSVTSEFKISRFANAVAKCVMTLEIGMIFRGISMPVGTSCLVIARKPK